MSFQVNGTTVIDASRNFQSSSFQKTVNGQSIIGTGDLKHIRAGASTNHVVGDYIFTAHVPPSEDATNGILATRANFTGGNTYSGGYFGYGTLWYLAQPFYRETRSSSSYPWASAVLSGTWRLCNDRIGVEDQSVSPPTAPSSKAAYGFFARIS